MHRYMDINKKTFFANKGIVPYRKKTRRSKKKVNYQLRYYFLIFFFFFMSFGYIFIKILQDENSIFKDVYRLFFNDLIITTAKNSPPSVEESSAPSEVNVNANPSPEVGGKVVGNENPGKLATTDGEQAREKRLHEEIITLYLAKFSTEKNVINFIPLPQRVTYENKKQLLPNIVRELIDFKSAEEKLNYFFSPQIKLRGFFIENETLVLNFNRFLENSKYGYKGLEVRLQQILWTLLNLPSDLLEKKISFVSILVDGERKSRLGGDGFLLKPFYYRKDLKNKVVFN